MDVALRIRDILTDRDIRHKTLAGYLNLSQGTLSNYVRGDRTIPYDVFIKIADYLNVTTDYLLGRTDEAAVPLRLNESERHLIEDLRTLNPDQKAIAAQNIQFMAKQNRK